MSEAFEAERDAYIEELASKEDSERFGNWVSKAAAAKLAGIARPTLDEWISNGTIPATAVREEVKGKKTFYKLDADEVARIAATKVADRPREIAKKQRDREDGLVAKANKLEAENRLLKEQNATLSTSVKLLEQSKEEVAGAVRNTEQLLREQLAKAESQAREAREEAAKANQELLAEKGRGFLGRLFR